MVLQFPAGTTDFLFCLNVIAFLSSMGRAAENSNVKIALIKASSSFLIMVPVL
jgi:hypothetical protein